MPKKKNVKPLVIKQAKEKPFVPLTTEFLRKHKILTEFKIRIIEHPAKRKILIGGKNSGKTVVAKLDELIFHENNAKGSSFAFRKHKEMASEKLGDYFSRAIQLVSHYGYKFRSKYGWEQRRNRFYSKDSYKDMKPNSYQQYGSIEDPSSTDGSAPSNLGFYGRVHFDEPIVKEDMLDNSKIPTPEEWDSGQQQINDNLGRYNAAFERIYGQTPPPLTTYYTMNDYGGHPLSLECQENFSQDAFVKWITGYHMSDLLGNKELIKKLCKHNPEEFETILDSKWGKMWMERTGKAVYNKYKDTLYVRMTKLDNPDEQAIQKATKTIKEIANGFIYENYRKLAVFAGLQFQAEIQSDMLVFNITNFNNTTFEEKLKEGWKPLNIVYSVDIDTSRVFTIVPQWLFVKMNMTLTGGWLRTYGVLIDKIIDLPAGGSGDFGERHELNAKQIALMMRKHFLDHIERAQDTLQSSHLIVDDNRKHYLNLIRNHTVDFIEHFSAAEKQGHFDIINRQDYLENGFKDNSLWNHKKNVLLENDIKKCVKSDINSPKRKTSGATNYLDRIDPTEYGMYVNLGYIIKPIRKGRKNG